MVKWLDTIADFIGNFGVWFLNLFGSNDTVKQIQDKTIALCGFLPTAASVAAMLSAGNPAVTGVIGIATAICRAVSASRGTPGLTLASMDSGGYGEVNGVPIEGGFVGGK